MVIKSPFKDYYDYVANLYGGGDPKIVYARTRLVALKPRASESFFVIEADPSPLVDPYWHRSEKRWAYLIVAGKVYLISRPAGDLNDNISGYKLEPLVDLEDEARPYWKRWRPRDIEFGKEYPSLILLSQKVGHPVFVVLGIEYQRYGQAKISISGQCPILQNLGMPALIPAHQMYQDLAYFVGNLMHASPDVQPPVQLSNRQRILKAGFDLVQSFRHRK